MTPDEQSKARKAPQNTISSGDWLRSMTAMRRTRNVALEKIKQGALASIKKHGILPPSK